MPNYVTKHRAAGGRYVYTYDAATRLKHRRGATVAHKRQGAQGSARVKGLEFSLTTLFLKQLWDDQGGLCALSGRQLGLMGDGMYSPSIDRIDPTRGYTPDNVQWVIWFINDAKSNMQNGDFITICKDVASRN